MGIVYLVKDSKLRGREAALKMTHPELVSNEEAKQRFKDEVILCLELLHPNIVRVNNLDEWNNQLYFTMEYIPGKSLRQVIDERKDKTPPYFSLKESIQIINPILDALSYAHQTTIHRDIKPENILIQGDLPDIKIKVLDFGIAKVLSASRFTRTAQSMGTAYYMSPEQMQGEENIDYRSDIYSVGMLFYELLTGKIAAGRFKLPSEMVDDIPTEIDEMFEKVLSPYPEDRFEDTIEMRSALSEIKKSNGVIKTDKLKQAAQNQKSYGSLSIETNPPGAQIFLQSKSCGNSPVNLNKVTCGNWLLKAEKENFETIEKEVEIFVDKITEVKLDMNPVFGSIFVDSNLSGAEVWIDGRQIEQKTPCNLNTILAGEHSVKVSLDGFREFEEKIQIISGGKNRVWAKLTKRKADRRIETQAFERSKLEQECQIDIGECIKALNYSQGTKSYIESVYEKRLEIWVKTANLEIPEGQYMLARCYNEGFGMNKNSSEAIKLYLKAADQGLALAKYNLGYMYFEGQGVSQNYVKAIHWYKKAADQGLAPAQFNLGVMYDNGQGVRKNINLAKKFYKKAAEQDFKNASERLIKLDSSGTKSKGKNNKGCFSRILIFFLVLIILATACFLYMNQTQDLKLIDPSKFSLPKIFAKKEPVMNGANTIQDLTKESGYYHVTGQELSILRGDLLNKPIRILTTYNGTSDGCIAYFRSLDSKVKIAFLYKKRGFVGANYTEWIQKQSETDCPRDLRNQIIGNGFDRSTHVCIWGTVRKFRDSFRTVKVVVDVDKWVRMQRK
ncbi:MAG: PEGA domain-containing protein [Desulfobacula sp.]|nr:PEGA domain-containing protein [Desulfobacula sp.]